MFRNLLFCGYDFAGASVCFSPHPRVLGTSGGSRVLGIKFL